jgi:hypothetical protein
MGTARSSGQSTPHLLPAAAVLNLVLYWGASAAEVAKLLQHAFWT